MNVSFMVFSLPDGFVLFEKVREAAFTVFSYNNKSFCKQIHEEKSVNKKDLLNLQNKQIQVPPYIHLFFLD